MRRSKAESNIKNQEKCMVLFDGSLEETVLNTEISFEEMEQHS